MKTIKRFVSSNSLLTSIIISIVFVLLIKGNLVNAQFAYVGAGVDYSSTVYAPQSVFASTNTSHSALSVNLSASYRPLKFVSAGIFVSKPILQNSTFSFMSDTSSSDFKDFDPDDYFFDARYAPTVYDYKIWCDNSYSFLLRFYFFKVFYADFSLTSTNINEHFQLKRNSKDAVYNIDYESYDYGEMIEGAVSELDFDIIEKHKLISPGANFGLTIDLTPHVFMDLWAGIKFLKFGSPSFSEQIDISWDEYSNEYDYVYITSPVTGQKILTNFGFKVGYRF